MEFIEPKPRGIKTTWFLSKQARELVKAYSQYTKYSEAEVVDLLLTRVILGDDKFKKWVLAKRNNKRLMCLLPELASEEGLVNE